MGKPVISWEDRGTFIRVYADIPARRNGLPNTGAMQAALSALDAINPDAFDPVEGVPEGVARAALRDREAIIPGSLDELRLERNGLLAVEGDEIPGAFRCANNACSGE